MLHIQATTLQNVRINKEIFSFMLNENNTYPVKTLINHLSFIFYQKTEPHKYEIIVSFISLAAINNYNSNQYNK